MLFKVNREDILLNLQSTASIIEKKQTMAILSNILVKAEKKALIMVGTDLEIQLVTQTPAEIHREGEITFSARKFLDICRNLPENAFFSVELTDDKIHIQSGRTRFKLGTLNPKSYPEFSTDDYQIEFEIKSDKLRKLLQSTGFCMANQDVRYYLNGLMIEIDRLQIGAVASDGHRLAMYHETLEQTKDFNKQIIIPRKGIMELTRLLDGGDSDNDSDVLFRVSESNIEISIDKKTFFAKLIDGQFPDFKGALSQPISCRFLINTLELKSALARVAVLSHEKFRRITLEFNKETLSIHADNTEHEQADEEIDITYAGEKFEVGLNVSYLVEAISNIHNETVDISFTENTNICLIGNPVDPNLNYIIMPLV